MTNGTYLTRAQILCAQDLAAEDVSVPEWGGTVRVRAISAAERFEIRHAMDTNQDVVVKLAAMAICDHDGNRLFTDTDLEALGKKSTQALARVFDVAMRLSAMNKGAVEEAAKNSGPSPSASSPSN